MSSNLDWNGDEAMKHVRAEAAKAIRGLALRVRGRAMRLLGAIAGSVSARDRGRGLTRQQVERIRDSVATEMNEGSLTARVGTNDENGKALELGTKRGITPKPWLRPALNDYDAQAAELRSGQ